MGHHQLLKNKAACDVFKGINAKEQAVFADEIASAITIDMYTKAYLKAVAAGRNKTE